MISDLGETILLQLKNNIDPMTSEELAEATFATKQETLNAINELRSVELINRCVGGYRAVTPNDPHFTEAPVGNSDFEKVLFIFATMKKRAFVKAIAEHANLTQSAAGRIIGQLLDAQIVECRTPGTHYLTMSGIQFIRETYPNITIPAHVISNAENPIPVFQVSRPRQKIKIPNLDKKLTAVNSVMCHATAENKKELTELVTFLQLSA